MAKKQPVMIDQDNLTAWISLLVGVVLIQTGCNGLLGRNMELKDLDNPDPTVRVMAIKWAGENKLSSAVPQLVDLLQHEDRSVRFYAIGSLKRITGTDNGFDYKTDPKKRAAAVQRWREFIKSNKSSNYEN